MIVYYSMEFFRKKKKKSWTVVLKKVFFYSMAVINVLTIAVSATTFKPFFINFPQIVCFLEYIQYRY